MIYIYIYIYIYDYQRKFRNLTSDYTESCCWRSICQLRDVIAQMWYSTDVRHEDLAGRKCAKCRVFSIVLWLRRLGKSAPKNRRARRICCPRCDKICTTPARESDLEVKNVKNWQRRSTFGSWSRQNLHHACARERFGSQNRKKLTASEHLWKLKSSKFAPRLPARTIWKSKSLKT